MKRTLISIIIPCYKQEKTIVRDLRRIYKNLKLLRHKIEIICVIDGMIDKSYEKANKFAKQYKGIRVFGYETNKGKGYAVRFGMARCKGEIIGFMDAGMDINPNGLAMLLEHFEWYKADIVVGSKRHPVSKIVYPWQRKILSFGYQMLVGVLFGLKIKDTQVGMKFFKREVLEKVLPRLLVKAFAFDIEMLAVANHLGYKRIYEAPVELSLIFDTNSSIVNKGFIKNVSFTLWDTIAVFYRLKIKNYYSDKNHRRWRYDPELSFRVNI